MGGTGINRGNRLGNAGPPRRGEPSNERHSLPDGLIGWWKLTDFIVRLFFRPHFSDLSSDYSGNAAALPINLGGEAPPSRQEWDDLKMKNESEKWGQKNVKKILLAATPALS